MPRRLPFYLLLDISESMIGEPVAKLNEAAKRMFAALKRNPLAMDTMHVCVITFANVARMPIPLTELNLANLPPLSVRPGTALGAALTMLKKSLDEDVVKNSPEAKGDYKPVVFVVTDGEPTDEWLGPLKALENARPRPDIVCVGCGDEVNFSVLTRISEKTVSLVDLTDDSLPKFFAWVSASVGAHSEAVVSGGGERRVVSLEKIPLPAGAKKVNLEKLPETAGGKRIFLHSKCGKTGKHYTMICERDEKTGIYRHRKSHPLPENFFEGAASGPARPVNIALARGAFPCPFCGGNSFCFCGSCRNLFCRDRHDPAPKVVCPHCREVFGRPAEGGDAVMDDSMG
ncbi:MAG: VWA domain-containing protein [Deltaproteobacteria bacterium]|jgi:uncharacterized protein YegL|nr:VWA domain-containing protein [Deltaproteobacteria bacterium]